MARVALWLQRGLFLVLACLPPAASGQTGPAADDPPRTLEELLDRVRGAADRERVQAAERERRFLAARNEQAARLAEVRRAREAADREADQLRRAFEAGESELTELATLLAEESGDLTELFAVSRQTAADVRSMLTDSLVGAQYPERGAKLDGLASPDRVPGLDELRGLWVMLLEEMEGSGKVVRLPARVISAAGEELEREVTRIGPFTAIADGHYLRYLAETGRFLAINTAAAGTRPAALRAFESGSEPILPLAIDPSRGTIMSLVVQAPDFTDRLRQGGVIGYLIIALGLLGLFIALERLAVLFVARWRLDRALRNRGRFPELETLRNLVLVADPVGNLDAVAARVDEVLSAASRRLRRGVQLLTIFAAVTPLLGLLGTVTGMIETFQVITLFGAGDPRLMSGGISQALVTTQLGLCAAIPLLLLHSFIQGRANAIMGLLDEASAGAFAAANKSQVSGSAREPIR